MTRNMTQFSELTYWEKPKQDVQDECLKKTTNAWVKQYIHVITGTAEVIEIIKCKEEELFQFHICKSIPSKYTEMFLEAISTY